MKTGDVVQLKSGGPLMTVNSCNELSCNCVWFDIDQKIQYGSFNLNMMIVRKSSAIDKKVQLKPLQLVPGKIYKVVDAPLSAADWIGVVVEAMDSTFSSSRYAKYVSGLEHNYIKYKPGYKLCFMDEFIFEEV